MGRFADKVVLITGGGQGIGRATALKVAGEGANVVIGNRNEQAGNDVVAAITSKGGKASFLRTDVTKEADIEALIQHALSTYGAMHAAFNNAGVEDPAAPLADQEESTLDLMYNVNVKGVWFAMKHQIKHMLGAGGGSIVNNASIAGQIGFPMHGPYVASKHAVLGLTRTAALEYGKQGVRVNAVSPGPIETTMIDRFTGSTDEGLAMIRSMVPIDRIGKPEEIADATAWLLSDEASFVHGQSIVVDGAFTAV